MSRLKRDGATADASHMASRWGTLAVPLAVACAGAGLLAVLGLVSPGFTDYELEAEPALQALRAGDVSAFLSLAPAYGGSLVLRAPFALLPGLWDGGDLALFRSMALPCLLAGVALAVVLWSRGRRLGRSAAACWTALALVAVNPLTLRALEIGHPEELLGAVLCVAAVLAAGARRPAIAGVLLGLAIANKPWAVLAILPVLVVLQRGRVRALAVAGLTATAAMLPLLLAGGLAVEQAAAVASDTGSIFQPWQIWWFLGDAGGVVTGNFGVKPDYRTPPEWLAGIGHPLVVLLPVAICLALVPRLRSRPWHDGLLLLALAMLLRCVLDPWNVSYYALPFLIALVAWELHAYDRVPVASLAATLLAWVTLVSLPQSAHPDLQAAAYLAWSVPLALLLTAELVRPRWLSERRGDDALVALRRQAT